MVCFNNGNDCRFSVNGIYFICLLVISETRNQSKIKKFNKKGEIMRAKKMNEIPYIKIEILDPTDDSESNYYTHCKLLNKLSKK